ncbi:MAG TPA: hypothetical protein VEX41_06990 [Candidatus Eisenbacteria bacterium]|nr:hypothetical protein [Candidatus Eisenbacteria bacterium]
MNTRSSTPAVLLAIIGVIALVAACGPGGAAAPTPGSTSTPAPTASPAASGPHKLTAGSLPPGDYTTTEFQPTLHFTLGEGWGNNFPDDSDEIALNRGADISLVAFSRVSRVVDPTTHQALPVPEDLLGWLAAHPSFEWTGASVPVEIAGLSGGTLKGQLENGLKQTDMFAWDTGNMRVVPGNQVQFYVLPLDGPDLTIVVMAEDAAFASVSEATRTMLDSLEVVTP